MPTSRTASSSAFRPTTTFAPFKPTTPVPKAQEPTAEQLFQQTQQQLMQSFVIQPTASVQQQVQQPAAVIRNLHRDMYTLAFLKTLGTSPKSTELLPEMISYWGVDKINGWVKDQNDYMRSIGKHIRDMPLIPTQPSSSMFVQSHSFANSGP